MQTDEAAQQAAITAAQKWLALVDANDYAASWNQTSLSFKSGYQTSALFKRGVTEQQWQTSVAAVGTELGKAERRRLRTKKYVEGLEGEADGEYVVIEYERSFTSGRKGVEKVTLIKEVDGEWRVTGYKVVGHI